MQAAQDTVRQKQHNADEEAAEDDRPGLLEFIVDVGVGQIDNDGAEDGTDQRPATADRNQDDHLDGKSNTQTVGSGRAVRRDVQSACQAGQRPGQCKDKGLVQSSVVAKGQDSVLVVADGG